MLRVFAISVVGLGMVAVSVARADIGAVGAPYLGPPSEGQVMAPASDAAPQGQSQESSAADSQEDLPLLEIAFSQNRVYYERALATGVSAAERAKPGVIYEVVSYMPTSGGSPSQNQRMNEEARDNLRGVLEALRAQGVPDSRIRMTAAPYKQSGGDEPTPDYNTIAIFVR